jgi:hypothetical protein
LVTEPQINVSDVSVFVPADRSMIPAAALALNPAVFKPPYKPTENEQLYFVDIASTMGCIAASILAVMSPRAVHMIQAASTTKNL